MVHPDTEHGGDAAGSESSEHMLSMLEWSTELAAFTSDDDSRRVLLSDAALAKSIGKAYVLCKSGGCDDMIPTFIQAIEKLSQHHSWQVRLSTVSQITAIDDTEKAKAKDDACVVDTNRQYHNSANKNNGSSDDDSSGGEDNLSVGPSHEFKRLLCPHVLRLLADEIQGTQSLSCGWIQHMLQRENGFGGKESPCIFPLLVDQLNLEDEQYNGMTTGDYSTERFLNQFLAILQNLSGTMSTDLRENVASILAQLSKSFNFRVRKSCVATIAAVTRYAPSALACSELIPVFQSLSKDNIWGIRKCCAELLPEISSVVEPHVRRDVIVPCFVALAQDESRWVRHAAYNHLGELITTFVSPPPKTDAELKEWYNTNVATVNNMDATSRTDDLININTTNTLTQTIAGVDLSESSTDNDGKHNIDTARVNGTFVDNSNSVLNVVAGVGDEAVHGDTNATEDSAPDADTLSTLPVLRSKKLTTAQEQSKLRKRRISPAPWDLEKMTEFLNDEEEAARVAADDVDGGEVFEEPQDTVPDGGDDAAFNSYHYWRTPIDSVDVSSLLADLLPDSNTDAAAEVGHGAPSADVPRTGDATGDDSDASCPTADASDAPADNAIALDTSDKCGTINSTDSTADASCSDSETTTAVTPTAPLHVPNELIEHFNIMSEKSSTKNIDSDITRTCAFTLPAIVWALGQEHWHRIRDTYVRLAGDYDWKIRLTLAHSTHVCALILGKEITEKDLLPNFANFLKDWEEVTDGAITHVADFIQVISPDLRPAFLSALLSINVQSNNWRRRLAISEQLLVVLPVFPGAVVEQHICPAALSLAQDPVACVKRQACKMCAVVLGHLQADANPAFARTMCQRLITDLCRSPLSAARQGFALVCVHMCDHVAASFVAAEVLDVMCELAEDKIPNVRLVAATFFRQAHDSHFFDGDDTDAIEKVSRTMSKLQRDADKDVVYASSSEIDRAKMVHQP
eukprot:m.1200351 g.1200351  ORF g.1200351 m.1200351 type:complete len:971 (+) comp24573_c0_seq1:218-3130(+)